ncbi:MAG: hypothetical protein EOO41_01000 [Methanobacteriota archaeon]|nr:MAG: hypothetical protein EOO41_01000 [Euryarchaeota archaeon]
MAKWSADEVAHAIDALAAQTNSPVRVWIVGGQSDVATSATVAQATARAETAGLGLVFNPTSSKSNDPALVLQHVAARSNASVLLWPATSTACAPSNLLLGVAAHLFDTAGVGEDAAYVFTQVSPSAQATAGEPVRAAPQDAACWTAVSAAALRAAAVSAPGANDASSTASLWAESIAFLQPVAVSAEGAQLELCVGGVAAAAANHSDLAVADAGAEVQLELTRMPPQSLRSITQRWGGSDEAEANAGTDAKASFVHANNVLVVVDTAAAAGSMASIVRLLLEAYPGSMRCHFLLAAQANEHAALLQAVLQSAPGLLGGGGSGGGGGGSSGELTHRVWRANPASPAFTKQLETVMTAVRPALAVLHADSSSDASLFVSTVVSSMRIPAVGFTLPTACHNTPIHLSASDDASAAAHLCLPDNPVTYPAGSINFVSDSALLVARQVVDTLCDCAGEADDAAALCPDQGARLGLDDFLADRRRRGL